MPQRDWRAAAPRNRADRTYWPAESRCGSTPDRGRNSESVPIKLLVEEPKTQRRPGDGGELIGDAKPRDDPATDLVVHVDCPRLGVGCTPCQRSRTRQSIPYCASRVAAVTPVGPAPTMTTGTCSAATISVPRRPCSGTRTGPGRRASLPPRRQRNRRGTVTAAPLEPSTISASNGFLRRLRCPQVLPKRAAILRVASARKGRSLNGLPTAVTGNASMIVTDLGAAARSGTLLGGPWRWSSTPVTVAPWRNPGDVGDRHLAGMWCWPTDCPRSGDIRVGEQGVLDGRPGRCCGRRG